MIADALRQFFSGSSAEEAAQQQREALVDLLLWMMYVDKRLDLSERELIDAEMDQLPWTAVMPLDQYIRTSLVRARAAISEEYMARKYLGEIKDRLATPEMRQEAFTLCKRLAEVDGDLAEDESDFLQTLRLVFGLR